MLLTVGLSATCPKSVPPNQADRPRLWATLPNLEASFMDRPFIRAHIAASRASRLSGECPLLIRRGRSANRTSGSSACTVRRGTEGCGGATPCPRRVGSRWPGVRREAANEFTEQSEAPTAGSMGSSVRLLVCHERYPSAFRAFFLVAFTLMSSRRLFG